MQQLGELRERLEAKGRTVAFGLEMMGRVRELGSPDDVFAVCEQLGLGPAGHRLRPPARGHRRRFHHAEAFAEVLAGADALLPPGAPFHIHFSDIAYANRNETKHLPYGQGTLRAEPLREALARFERPATVISESPDEASSQAIGAILRTAAAEREGTRRARRSAGRRSSRCP